MAGTDGWTINAHPSPPPLSTTLTASRTPLANPSYSAAYRSPAPSLVSFSSPSASVIAFSESANGSSGSESDSGANSSDVQLGRLMSSSGGGTLSFPTTSAPLVHIAETTCPSCHLKSTKSHIPSPITSPSPSPCPSSPTPSQTVAADQTSTDDSAYPAHSTTAAGNDVTHNGAGDNEINGDLRRPDAGRRHDISERDSGCGSGGNRKVAQSSIRSNAGIVSSTDNVADAIIRTNGSTMTTSKMPSPGFLITDGLHRRILHTHRSPLTAGRMISDIIPGDVTFPSALHEQHSRDPIPSLSGSIQSPVLPNGKFCSPSQRQCPLPTPEHESVGLNLNVASSVSPALFLPVATYLIIALIQALYDKPPSEASCKPVSPTVAVTITPSPSPSPQHAPAPVYVTSASHLPASNPATPNRSPTHSVPGTPQFYSPVTSHPHTPTTFLRTSPRTPTTNPGSVNLALAPLVVVVNPTPQPTPHPTPPTTPTLVSAIVPSFVTACGVGLGPDQTSNSANIQSSLPTANAPASSSPRTSTLPTPHGNAILDTDRTRTGSVLACMGTTASARGPLPVPDQRDELPPGKPPSSVSPQLSKPGLSVMVDKDRTLKPSDRRFFLLQSPERSPDSVVSPGASSSTDIACSDDSSKNANLGRPTVVVAPRVAQRGREPAMEVVDEDKVTARNTWQSEDVDPGAVKERSLSRDSRPPSRTKNRSSGALTASKRTTSTTSLAGGTRARTKGLGLGGGLTMTKGKGVVGRTGITGKGALGMKRAASSGILPTVTAAHADELSTKKAVVANGKGKSSRAEVLTPPCPNAVMHRASFNIGSGSSEGVEVGEGGETSSRSASASIGGSGGARELTRKMPTAARSSNVVPNGGRQSPPPLEGQITNKPTKLPIPPQVVARLPNPASLALNPEAATAAIQPSRKRVVMTNTSSEDYETESNSEEEEEEAGSWASEDISEGDDDEMGFAKGGQKGGSSSVGKRSHQRGGSVGSRGKGPSSGHSRIGGPSKAKVKSPLQAPAPAPAQRTKSSGLQHQHQRPVAPQLHRRHTSTAIHPQAQAARRLLSKEDEAALKLQAAAVEAQRQRELFTKVPVQPTMQRTRSGLLSQLMNPDPSIFPPNHPYRQSYSAVDLRKMATVPRVVSAGAGGFAIRSGGNVVATLPSIDDITSGHVRRPSEQAPKLPPIVGSWRSTKGAAAMPLAAQVTVSNVPAPNQSGGSGPYRPKGRPQEEELEDDTDTDDNADNSVPMSESYVYQKLAQMVGRRGAVANGKQRADAVPPKRPEPIRALTTSESTSSHDARVSATPVPLAHPYNLPPPSPPSTPRTTRQRFLQSEMPESLRRNLLWERQVSKMNLGPRRRSTGTGEGTAGRPGHLTTTPSMVQLSAKTSNTSVREEEEKERQRQRELEAKENEERMRRVLAKTRNRSWADDYHASGW
ncbi:hypothetical protein CCMSSC00406_0007674 [Pleurotus cornucopiae]|uniref:Uncharacterized protein n=1 Tax=Pleurotus cornucopiae TaxID=5321 RepID=A0ACB7J5I1_PLECO|nr:hypothetical protein CCMSSC00406_0007674 [Pleurotus cornucopiae]